MSFEWIWTQIAEELRERRHDSKYENVSKGLKSAPSNQLALAAPKAAPTPAPKEREIRRRRSKRILQLLLDKLQMDLLEQIQSLTGRRFHALCMRQDTAGLETSVGTHMLEIQDLKRPERPLPSTKRQRARVTRGKERARRMGRKEERVPKPTWRLLQLWLQQHLHVTISQVEGRKVMTAWERSCNFC